MQIEKNINNFNTINYCIPYNNDTFFTDSIASEGDATPTLQSF